MEKCETKEWLWRKRDSLLEAHLFYFCIDYSRACDFNRYIHIIIEGISFYDETFIIIIYGLNAVAFSGVWIFN